jgi:argininosuccinate lyase
MKLWQNSFTEPGSAAKLVEEFTVGKDKQFDMLLASYDVIGSMAHAKMLEHVGLISAWELEVITSGLQEIFTEVQSGSFVIEDGVEDVHSQVEFSLVKKIGEPGKKIHTGRSRNDQVLLDIKLFLRGEIEKIANEVNDLFELLIVQSEKFRSFGLPGYTHFQAAMPSSFGLWFAAYAESLIDDMELLCAAEKVINKNPLGSGAGFGSAFPLDREMTTQLLDFDTLNHNVVYAQMSRGKTEKILSFALSGFAATLGKLSYDVCLYMSQDLGFISFPDSLTTGSSLMPHKKNPDVFELIRAKSSRIQAVPNELALLTNNLPSGYHRDMQLTKEILFPAIEELRSCLRMMTFMLENIRIKENILDRKKYDVLFSVEAVNMEVMNGVPFRDAYKRVSESLKIGSFTAQRNVEHVMHGSAGNLCNEKLKEEMDKLMQRLHCRPKK